jgi:hypothetical protein
MAQQTDIKEMLLRSKAAAQKEMDLILAAEPLNWSFFHDRLYGFILEKYMLRPEDDTVSSFHELTELSLSRSMKISRELVRDFDLAKGCHGASSTAAKKVLLFMAMQKALGIEFDAKKTAELVTTEQLIRLVWDTMNQTPEWNGRLCGVPDACAASAG